VSALAYAGVVPVVSITNAIVVPAGKTLGSGSVENAPAGSAILTRQYCCVPYPTAAPVCSTVPPNVNCGITCSEDADNDAELDDAYCCIRLVSFADAPT